MKLHKKLFFGAVLATITAIGTGCAQVWRTRRFRTSWMLS